MVGHLESDTIAWAFKTGILKYSTPLDQARKALEEANEMVDEVEFISNNPDVSKDRALMELGDLLVASAITANLLGSNLQDCMSMAYEKIIKRKGRMINRVWVKE